MPIIILSTRVIFAVCQIFIKRISINQSISYFKSLGADCPKRLSKAMGLHSDNEEEDGDVKLDVTKACLYFACNLCSVFWHDSVSAGGR